MFFFFLVSIAISAVGATSEHSHTVKEIVENINQYLKENGIAALRLPDIGVLSTSPIKMRKGILEALDTIQLLEEPVIKKKKNRDHSTTYMFWVTFALKELTIRYHFKSSIPVTAEGETFLTPEKNSLDAAGVVVLGDGQCDARLYSVTVQALSNLTIGISPNQPKMAELTKAVLEFAVPKIVEVADAAFEAETLDPIFQAWFSDFVCLYLKPKKLLDFIQNY